MNRLQRNIPEEDAAVQAVIALAERQAQQDSESLLKFLCGGVSCAVTILDSISCTRDQSQAMHSATQD